MIAPSGERQYNAAATLWEKTGIDTRSSRTRDLDQAFGPKINPGPGCLNKCTTINVKKKLISLKLTVTGEDPSSLSDQSLV